MDTLRKDGGALLSRLLTPEGLEQNSKVVPGKGGDGPWKLRPILIKGGQADEQRDHLHRQGRRAVRVHFGLSEDRQTIVAGTLPRVGTPEGRGGSVGLIGGTMTGSLGVQVQFYQLEELMEQLIPYYNLKFPPKTPTGTSSNNNGTMTVTAATAAAVAKTNALYETGEEGGGEDSRNMEFGHQNYLIDQSSFPKAASSLSATAALLHLAATDRRM